MADDPSRPPGTDPKPDSAKGERGASLERKELNLLGLGVQLAGIVTLSTLAGWWVDSRTGWSPWGMAALGFAGLGAGLYQFVKDATR